MSPKQECEMLLNTLLQLIEVMLKKNGEFYPTGAVITNDYEQTFTTLENEDNYIQSQEIVDALIDIHKEMAQNNEIIASGIATNTKVSLSNQKELDGILVSLEHRENYSISICLPYKKGLFKKINFGEIFALEGKHDIF